MSTSRVLLTFQYLGFRFDGVQKHPGLKTIHEILLNRFHKAFPGRNLKIRFSSRTDKMVSSLESYCLFMIEGDPMPSNAVDVFNQHLPADIKILNALEVDANFSLLSRVQQKIYHYYFSMGERGNPLAAPYITSFNEMLDLEQMQKAALLFQGSHTFVNYTIKEKTEIEAVRAIDVCRIEVNTKFTASFFPQTSYYLNIQSKSFMRGQVRLIMGALVRVGLHELTLEAIATSLKKKDPTFIKFLAPASGLMLIKSQLNTGSPSSSDL
jgi:tRNA pseudouridine38-40 synthase